MLKLFKYNWKKSELLYYSLFGINAVALAIFLLIGRKDIWWDEFAILAALSVTSIVMQVLFIFVIYNFNAGLKSITRRLLPINETKEYIAHLLVPVIYNMSFSLQLWLFIVLLKPQFEFVELNTFIQQFSGIEVTLSLLTFTLFYNLLSISMYYFAVAFARMFKTNLRILIFLATVFVLNIIYALSTELMEPSPDVFHMGNIYVEIGVNNSFALDWFAWNWMQVAELSCMLLLAFVTVYIMKKKIEA